MIICEDINFFPVTLSQFAKPFGNFPFTTPFRSPNETEHNTRCGHAHNGGVRPTGRAKGGNWDWALVALVIRYLALIPPFSSGSWNGSVQDSLNLGVIEWISARGHCHCTMEVNSRCKIADHINYLHAFVLMLSIFVFMQKHKRVLTWLLHCWPVSRCLKGAWVACLHLSTLKVNVISFVVLTALTKLKQCPCLSWIIHTPYWWWLMTLSGGSSQDLGALIEPSLPAYLLFYINVTPGTSAGPQPKKKQKNICPIK